MTITTYDVVIIGSGAAGLTAAINLAQDRRVLVLAKGALDSGSTNWAQGGIAAVLDAGDSFAAHVEDTMVAGAGLNNRETVEFVVSEAPAAIERPAVLGGPFNDGEEFGERWHLTREGGHSHRRIVHVDDATGAAVQAALIKAAHDNPNITLLEDFVAIDLITSRHGERYSGDGHVWGVYALNRKAGRVDAFVARATILATGAITLGELLSRAASDRPDDAAFQRCLFLILEQAIDPRTTDVAGGASILSTRFDAGFVEGTDVRFSRATGGGVHASQ